MTVHFIGAGPGAPDLITVRGLNLIRRCPVCLYAGSLVPCEVVAEAPAGAEVIDTSRLDLDAIVARIERAHVEGKDVARIHSGDPSLYGAIAEQIRRLDRLGIAWDITPGVPSFAAAAAALGRELTVPGVAQSVVLTRVALRSSAMPDGETLAAFAATGATLVVHLAIRHIERVVADVLPFYAASTPAAVVYRASWPDERVLRGTLDSIAEQVRRSGIERTAVILIGPALAADDFRDSRLYAGDHVRAFRPEPKG
ncbi:precorrin-4 C(11)-methyltransferase [Marinivivus vitaminiproducens]|uniref:precorrin-4 C(11)-methyltransferase n=1 Tax=Marinivivus vitaminiproducens TaxID=3035935 RepID=UPI002797DC5D|nr:precorrin-4 C(11)-methyltransferase [Geminicoccaceae bacterium SCSIO 64248]